MADFGGFGRPEIHILGASGSGQFAGHELFCALCDVPVHLKLVWDGTSNV